MASDAIRVSWHLAVREEQRQSEEGGSGPWLGGHGQKSH
jgi:hypothetical protein